MMDIDQYIKDNNAQITDSVDSLWSEIIKKLNNYYLKTKNTQSTLPEEHYFILRNGFVLIGEYQHVNISTKQLSRIYIADERLDSVLVEVDPTKVTDLVPVFSYSTHGKKIVESNFENPNEIKTYVKYNFGMRLLLSIEDGGATGQLILEFANEINEDLVIDPQVYEILKRNPFLIGFVGIKNRYIPIVLDNENVLSEIGINVNALSITGSVKDTLVTKVDIRNLFNKPETVDVPIILFKNKVFYAFRSVPKELLDLITSSTVKIGRYKFENNTHISIIIIRNISDYVKHTEFKDYTPLATFITEDTARQYKNDIQILAQSMPLSKPDLEKIGLSNEILEIYLRLSGVLLSQHYAISKDILTAVYSIMKNGINYLINETDATIVKQDVEKILAVIAFYYEYYEENKEGKMLLFQLDKIDSELKNLISTHETVKIDKYKNKLKILYKISTQDADNIIENMKNMGFFEEIEEEGRIMLTDEVEKQILNAG
jgi:hypothetical protein